MNSNKKLVIVAGGSAGHILPALNLAKSWKEKNKNSRIMFIGSSRKIDSKIVEGKDFIDKTTTLWIDKLPTNKILLLPYFCLQFTLSFFKSLFSLLFFRPQKVLTTGGLVALPVCFAAKMLGINIELYELNAIPGRASLVIARLARNIFVTFQSCKKHFEPLLGTRGKCGFESYPTRFSKNDLIWNKNEVIENLNKNLSGNSKNFSAKRKTIFILGGSAGSKYLNEIFKTWVSENNELAPKIQVIHQIGSDEKEQFDFLYDSLSIPHHAFSYDENIKDFYLLSDLVISRGGAGTLFELEFFKRKALIIPLKTASTDHQINNAQEMVKKYPEFFMMHHQGSPFKDLPIINSSIKKLLGI